jgi:hypothetical protein
VATASIPAVPLEDDEPDPSPVATLAGEVRADQADMGDTRNLEFIVSLPGISNDPDLQPAAEAAEEPVETVEGELLPIGPAFPADDSPTVADYRAPALAIVTDYAHEDSEDYLGSRRRRAMPWRRYPLGAVVVAVLILLITGFVAVQALSGNDTGNSDNSLPGRVPGVDMPGGGAPAAVTGSPADEQTEEGTEGADPTTTRPRTVTTAPGGTHASGSTPPSTAPTKTSAAPPPPVAQPTQGRLVGSQSRKCVEYRSGSAYRVVIDNCDAQPNQVWRVQGNAATGATLLADIGWCLDVQNAGTGNGNAIQAYRCNGTVAQVWVHRADNTWMNPFSKRCLTAANNATGAGTPLVLWDCTGAASQIWAMQ